ncbi:MAG: FAD-dependent oxidoreductase [Oscillospiraceae bacterium]
MKKISYQREIPEKYSADICIVGGGPAGVTAAVAAARQGCKVFLAEGAGCFGGAAVTALVPAFMPFDNGKDFLAGGLGREIYDRCEKTVFPPGGGMGIHPEKYKRLMDSLVCGEENITFSFFTSLIGVEQEDDRVSHCIFAAKSGLFAVSAKVFIDCTGDGDLCAWAGAPFELGDSSGPPMPATLCSVWGDIDWNDKSFSDDEKLEQAIADGVFTQEDRHLPGMWRTGEHQGGGNIGHSFGVDATDEVSLTQAMLAGRRILPEYERYYRKYLGRGYRNTSLAVTGSQLGIRASRRIQGDYVMTGEDFHSRARFADEIGVFSYPVDIHIANPSKEAYEEYHRKFVSMRYGPGEFYGIPYRSLLPKGLENVLVAGRCISTDKLMQSSVRVMPGCFITGQAAGVGAAVAVRSGTDPGQANIGEIRSVLGKMGAFLPG